MLYERTVSAASRACKRTARLAMVVVALAGLTACGGGGGGGTSTPETTPTPTTPDPTPNPAPTTPTPSPEIPITPTPAPATDHPGTLEAAADITAGQPVEGSIDSPEDVDVFKLQLTGAGARTVTFWTTGDADVAITLKDGEGNDLSATGASSIPGSSSGIQLRAAAVASGAVVAASDGRVSVTTPLEQVYADLRGRQGSTGDYTLHNEVAANLAPRVLRAFSGVTVKAGASVDVDLSNHFEDPEGGTLTFMTSFGAGQVGPVSLGVTISGSIMTIASPAAMRAGPVSISVTASDPFGLVSVEVLTVTVQPGDSPPGAGLDGCVTARVGSRDTACGLVYGPGVLTYHIQFTNSCSQGADVYWQWNPKDDDPVTPGWSATNSHTISAGDTEALGEYFCYQGQGQPRARVCVDGPLDNRCISGNPPWREL